MLVVDKLTYAGNLASLGAVQGHPRYRFSRTDICNRSAIAEIFAAFDPDAVMHLAAESHVDRSIDGPADFIETNVVGTFVLLEAALSHWRKLAPARALDRVEPRSNGAHRDLVTFVPRPARARFPLCHRFAKLNAELGWRPRHSFDEGLHITVKWYIDNRAWWAPLLSAHDAAAPPRACPPTNHVTDASSACLERPVRSAKQCVGSPLPAGVEIVAPDRGELDLRNAEASAQAVVAQPTGRPMWQDRIGALLAPARGRGRWLKAAIAPSSAGPVKRT